MAVIILFALAAGAAFVDFCLRRVWLAVAVGLLAFAFAVMAASGHPNGLA